MLDELGVNPFIVLSSVTLIGVLALMTLMAAFLDVTCFAELALLMAASSTVSFLALNADIVPVHFAGLALQAALAVVGLRWLCQELRRRRIRNRPDRL